MEKKKTNKVVVFLVFILTTAACAGFIWFKLQEVEKNKTNDDKKKSSEKISDKTKDETKKDNNTTNNETVEEIKYENYTSANIQHGTNNNGMEYVKLQIIDGNLKVTVNEKEIKVNGFTSKVKSFTYGNDCGGSGDILAITEDNKIYLFSYSFGDEDFKDQIVFKEIKTNENIVDITKRPEIGWTTCGEPYLAVVLKNKEIRALYYDGNDYKIGTFDYSIINPYNFHSFIILYNDNTISEYYGNDKYDGIVKEKIKFNNKEIIVDKFIVLNRDNSNENVYVISNNKLYKISVIFNAPDNVSSNVTLVNNNDIKSESLVVSKGINEYTNGEKTDLITFTDGKQVTISNISSVYSTK